MKYVQQITFAWAFLVSAMLFGCKDLDRDNNLDPKNPDAASYQIAVVENFVHRYTTGDSVNAYIRNSQEALYELTGKYQQRMIIAEYHMRLTDTTKKDTFALPENETRYVNEYQGGALRGFPHTFFNGHQIAIQGASSKAVARQRYETTLDSLTTKTSRFYGQAEMDVQGDSLTVRSRLVKFGEEDASNLLVEYLLLEDKGDLLHFTVRQFGVPEPVYQLQATEIMNLPVKKFKIRPYYNINQLSVVVIIKDGLSKKILQACLAE